MNKLFLAVSCIVLAGCQTAPVAQQKIFSIGPACYSILAEGVSSDASETKLPRIFILHDKPTISIIAPKNGKDIDWIDGPDKSQFQGEEAASYWGDFEGKRYIVVGDGFSSLRLILSKNGRHDVYTGNAEHSGDVPPPPGTENPQYKVELLLAACPDQISAVLP